jgi:multidrug efflux pump subunit AcrB
MEDQAARKVLKAVLMVAALIAFGMGVRGGWAVAQTYFETKDAPRHIGLATINQKITMNAANAGTPRVTQILK